MAKEKTNFKKCSLFIFSSWSRSSLWAKLSVIKDFTWIILKWDPSKLMIPPIMGPLLEIDFMVLNFLLFKILSLIYIIVWKEVSNYVLYIMYFFLRPYSIWAANMLKQEMPNTSWTFFKIVLLCLLECSLRIFWLQYSRNSQNVSVTWKCSYIPLYISYPVITCLHCLELFFSGPV